MDSDLKKYSLGSLHMANAKAVHNTCQFKVAKATEQIFDMDINKWAPSAPPTPTMSVHSGQTITQVETGSYVRTMNHVITADESQDITIVGDHLE